MSTPIILLVSVVVLLAFLAGAAFMRNRKERDMQEVAKAAADAQEQTSANFYWALQVVNGVAYDEHNKLKPHNYPPRKVAEAHAILKSMGVEE